jgi:type VI secretion system secreted protein VgrG
MAQLFKQENRQLTLSTPLGEDVLLLTSFGGEEQLSRLFSYRLQMLSANDALTASDLVGKNVTWAVQRIDGDPRYFNGLVNRFSAGALKMKGLRQYTIEVVPWLWFLTRTADCRIFQNKSVPDIVEQIFKDLGFTAFEMAVKGPHPKWDYCVQYRETDFNFVSRLLEQEGIFYWFRHDNGKHTLVLSDQKSAYQDCAENEVEYSDGSLAPNHIGSWEHHYEFRPGKWSQTDYNFETPSTSLKTAAPTVVKLPGVDKFEIYDYPGEYEKKGEGEPDTKIRMEEEEVSHDVVRGTSTCCTFTPGGKFTLQAHDCPSEQGKTYVIVSVQHWATVEESYSSNGTGENYRNTFTCIPESVTFRPARITPKPIVQGPQTAVVVGPAGEEIYTDKYSRVKVQFHWDREGKKNEKSSCWVRVSTLWAGKQWGVIHIPRIGQEVIVDFLEGDPDRPIIVGSVYNAEHMPPYGLPGNKTQSGIQSRSSLGGSAANFNEIRFEDKNGSELVTIHAEKDQSIGVEHDEAHWVGHDRKKNIDHDETTHVKHDRTETVDNNETITVHGNRTETVDKDETIKIHQNRTETVDQNETITVSGSRTRSVSKNETVTVTLMRTHTVGINEAITVGAAQEVTVGAFRALTVGGAQTTTIGASHSVTVGANQTVKVGGNQSISVTGSLSESIGGNYEEKVTKTKKCEIDEDYGTKIGKNLSFTAGEQITLTTGDAQIIMKKDGTIQIKGKDIIINGSGNITGKAASDMVLKGGSKVTLN